MPPRYRAARPDTRAALAGAAATAAALCHCRLCSAGGLRRAACSPLPPRHGPARTDAVAVRSRRWHPRGAVPSDTRHPVAEGDGAIFVTEPVAELSVSCRGLGCDGVERYSVSMCNPMACTLCDIVYLGALQRASDALAEMEPKTVLCESFA